MSQTKKNKMAISKLKSAVETKYVYNTRTYGVAVLGAEAHSLPSTVKGLDSDDRVGDEILSKWLTMNISVLRTDGSPFIRFLVLADKDNNNSALAPDLAQVFANDTSFTNMTISVLNKQFVGKTKKFSVVYDSGTIATPLNEPTKIIRIRKRLGYKFAYSTNLGTAADLIKNNLVLLVVADAVGVSWGFSAVLHYVDP